MTNNTANLGCPEDASVIEVLDGPELRRRHHLARSRTYLTLCVASATMIFAMYADLWLYAQYAGVPFDGIHTVSGIALYYAAGTPIVWCAIVIVTAAASKYHEWKAPDESTRTFYLEHPDGEREPISDAEAVAINHGLPRDHFGDDVEVCPDCLTVHQD